mgnify:CR=1 FL=1
MILQLLQKVPQELASGTHAVSGVLQKLAVDAVLLFRLEPFERQCDLVWAVHKRVVPDEGLQVGIDGRVAKLPRPECRDFIEVSRDLEGTSGGHV